MANFTMDKDMFFRRIKRFYDAWKNPEPGAEDSFTKMDAMISAVGADVDIVYSKSTALQTWLFGYELTDTVIVFTESSILLLASKKKIEFLKQISNPKDDSLPSIKLFVREKSDEDKANFQKLIDAIKESKEGKVVGNFQKDLPQFKLSQVDVSSAIAYVTAIKDDAELQIMRKASQVSVDVFNKYLKDQIMEIIDSDKKVKHSKLAEGVETALTDKKYVTGVDSSQLDMCYPPIIQSGGNYSLKFSVVSDKNILHFGSIVCSLGTRYKSYCSNIVRTLLVNPTDKVQNFQT
ncbi:hypothetical protein B566_EDAN014107 [Ephemera danica]|nr:hypothetical protein B566_EDAN014107 [Ephemera danica]